MGGAHIADLVEAATGINLWAEWAKVEIAGGKTTVQPARAREDYAGLLVSLARQEHPDTSQYNDPEIVWRMDKAQSRRTDRPFARPRASARAAGRLQRPSGS